AGIPGRVARRQLLKISARIGVGPSLRFLRKQQGLRSLLSRKAAADGLYDSLAPMLDEPELRLAGFQYFTFNQLIETWEWHQSKLAAGGKASQASWNRRGYARGRETTA